MLTRQHLEIYKNYGGDGDMFVRLGSEEEKRILEYEDWRLIEDFLQDIDLVNKLLTSPEFANHLRERLANNCDGEETINALKKLAVSA